MLGKKFYLHLEFAPEVEQLCHCASSNIVDRPRAEQIIQLGRAEMPNDQLLNAD